MEKSKGIWSKIKNSKKRTKIIFLIILILIIGGGILAFRGGEASFEWTEVKRGDVIQEVSATGVVESAEEVDLRFKSSGIVDKINVSVGDEVKKGDYLIQLSSGELYSQYLQAQSNYEQARAKLDQLLAGATVEEIRVAEQVVENTSRDLEDTRLEAENNLDQDYNSALVYLIDASSKYNNALADLSDIERLYFYRSSTLDSTFRSKKDQAENAFWGISSINEEGAEYYIDLAVDDSSHENIDTALIEMRSALKELIDALDYAKKGLSDPTIREDVSSTDRTRIETNITNANAAFSNINSAQKNIADQRVSNQISINSAENLYKKAVADLEELKAPPRGVDVSVYQADVNKYKANMNEYSQRLKDASIIAPFDGIVAKIDVKIGEVVTAAGRVVASLISPGGFQINADISEADIRKVDVGDSVDIVLDAFPEKEWAGRIVEIEPGETIIDGVVYYQTKILFDEESEEIRSGMSADATIRTDVRENVLFVPYRALVFKDENRYLRVIENIEKESYKEILVKTGIRGRNGEVEIVSGVNEGDKVVTFIKKDD
ncbi:MAG: efflux RND transporter periplasmic adaptor subunit [Candidatus Portnoybacteria bacterium]|nr:efflux RND transporter periplasmic adaptor subunit [Candidatus Portnoybacteria bacterium]